MSDDQLARIRALNDRLRRQQCGGKLFMTRGIANKEPVFLLQIMGAIRAFDGFSDDNDPYGEHDFGSVEIDGELVYWKIDYYDRDGLNGSEDPADEPKTQRILTIMLASEY